MKQKLIRMLKRFAIRKAKKVIDEQSALYDYLNKVDTITKPKLTSARLKGIMDVFISAIKHAKRNTRKEK